MIFTPTELDGAFLIDLEPYADARGSFARTVDVDSFATHGLNARFVQQSVAVNPHRGTLRGLHFQTAPYREAKLVRVTRGAVYDVLVDMREDSPTRGRWLGVELTAANRRQAYVPEGFAHGYQSLEPDTEVFYQMTAPYHPASARGIRWDDPRVGITWPLPVLPEDPRMVSSADRAWPYWVDDHAP